MFVRRGQVTVRLGAGLLLALTCAAAPAIALTPPAAGDAPTGGECAPDMAPSASATSTELGGLIEVTGDCFPTRSAGTVEIFIKGSDDSRQFADVATEGSESVYASFTPTVAGTYTALIEVGGETASSSFTVDPPAEAPEDPPTEPPVEEPTEPPTEEPSDPAPTDEPTTPAPSEEPTTPPPSDEPSTPAPSEEPTTHPPSEEPTDEPSDPAPSDESTNPSDAPSDPAESEEPDASSPDPDDQPTDTDDQQSGDASDESPSAPTKPFPSSEEDESQDDPDPSAASGPSESSPTPDTPAPPIKDFPSKTPAHSAEQQEMAELAVLMTSLFAHGVSEGEVGISPAEAGASGDGGASDEDEGDESADGSGASDEGGTSASGSAADGGDDELAETGAEVTVPAALAGLALLSGAGLLWHQRRRRD